MRRPLGKIILSAQIIGCIVGPLLFLAGSLFAAPATNHAPVYLRVVALVAHALIYLSSVITAVSYGTLIVTLVMGFRWTIIEASRDGLQLHLRGPMQRRGWFLQRAQIASLHKGTSLEVLDTAGRRIGKIDATTAAEERWVMAILGRVLDLPTSDPRLPR
jgi:hypothetical protein